MTFLDMAFQLQAFGMSSPHLMEANSSHKECFGRGDVSLVATDSSLRPSSRPRQKDKTGNSKTVSTIFETPLLSDIFLSGL